MLRSAKYRYLKNSECEEKLSLHFPQIKRIISKLNKSSLIPLSFVNHGRLGCVYRRGHNLTICHERPPVLPRLYNNQWIDLYFCCCYNMCVSFGGFLVRFKHVFQYLRIQIDRFIDGFIFLFCVGGLARIRLDYKSCYYLLKTSESQVSNYW